MKKLTIIGFIILYSMAACNSVKRITGAKQNGSNYIVTIEPNTFKSDSALISGSIRVVDSVYGSNRAIRFVRIVKLDTSDYSKNIGPDDEGNFRYTVPAGRYYLFFGGIGFGKMKTGEFIVRPGGSATLITSLHSEVEIICEEIINSSYQTVPKRH